jgi:hypothetical protein
MRSNGAAPGIRCTPGVNASTLATTTRCSAPATSRPTRAPMRCSPTARCRRRPVCSPGVPGACLPQGTPVRLRQPGGRPAGDAGLPASPRQVRCGHYVVTICCAGPASSRRQFFAVTDDLPTTASGAPFPRSWWAEAGRADRPGLPRRNDQLPVPLVLRVLRALTAGPENGGKPCQSLVVDPMVGGGAIAVACWESRRRLLVSDVNTQALTFTAARLTAEHVVGSPLRLLERTGHRRREDRRAGIGRRERTSDQPVRNGLTPHAAARDRGCRRCGTCPRLRRGRARAVARSTPLAIRAGAARL